MDFKKYNNLIELFFGQCARLPKEKILLNSLKDPKLTFSWGDVKKFTLQLSNEISKVIKRVTDVY